MKVIKRNGLHENVKFDKISNRIKKQTYSLNTEYVDYMEVSKKVINGLYDGVTSIDLDKLAAETAASLSTIHPDYSLLAARIAITSLHKQTSKKFSETAYKLYNYIDKKTGDNASMLSDDTYATILKYADEFDNMIVNDRDLSFNYFGYKTLERSYLLKIDGEIVETPQHMYMRVAVGIWGDNLEQVEKTYELLSTKKLSHATPTLFNSGTKRPQNSSCFLIAMKDDSIKGIYETLQDAAAISQSAGGIGLHIHDIRAKGSYIKGTNGTSNGIIPMLKVFNETARYVDQCFVGETKILTDNGYKEIQTLKNGNLVKTSDGNYNTIESVKKYDKENIDLVKIKTTSGEIRVTKEHPILVVKNVPVESTKDTIILMIKKGIYSVDWVDAKDISENDRILKY